MAMRRSRSLSLFQPSFNSTVAKLEGAVDHDDSEEDTKENIRDPTISTEYDELYMSEEDEDDAFPNGQSVTKEKSIRDTLKNDLGFVQALKECTNDTSTISYKKTLNKLNFDKSDYLKNMSLDEVQAKFGSLLKSLGKFRTFYSVIHDMEMFLKSSIAKVKHPDKPVLPLTPHQLYYKELCAIGKTAPANQNFMKWVSDSYKSLSVRDRSYYTKKHDTLMETYSRQLEDFYERYPEERPKYSKTQKPKIITPFNLFLEKLKTGNNNCKRADALIQWSNLSVKNKLGYIKAAYQYQNKEPNDSKKVTISIREKLLLEEHNGKPEKPPSSVYRMYIQENCEVPDIKNKYKTITKAEQRLLQDRLKLMVEQYKQDMTKYIKKLPEADKIIEKEQLVKFLSKYKFVTTSIDTPKSNKAQSSTLKRNSNLPPADNYVEVAENVPKKKKKVEGTAITYEPDVVSKAKKSPYKIASSEPVEVNNTPGSKKFSKKAAQTHSEVEIPEVKKEHEKKKRKKATKQQEFTEVKPPKNLFKYFVSTNSFISLDVAKNKYSNLSKSEKKTMLKSYNALCTTYIARLREYLSSLNESEMKAYIKKIEANKTLEEDTDGDSMISDGSDSDEDSDSE